MRVLLFMLLFGAAMANPAFTDLGGSRYSEAITYLAGRDLIGGFPDGSFRPTQAMTRAEFLAMAIRALQLPQPPISGQCLADLPAEAWYAPAVCTGVSLGLISSEPAELRPHDTILYSEALKVVITAFGFTTREVLPGEPWHAPYVSFAAETGLLSTLAYRPADFVTREVAASMLYRALILAGDDASRPVAAVPTTPLLPTPETADISVTPAEPAPAPEIQRQPEPAPTTGETAACKRDHLPAARGRLQVNGAERSLITYVPPQLQAGQPAALVVVFHGRTNSNEQVQRYMRLEGNGSDAIVVYPAALPVPGGGYSWQDPGDSALELRDYALFDRIVEQFTSDFCIDTDRIFVVGHSLGAYFANSVACVRAEQVRAVASVAGGILPATCPDEVAALLFHNPNDSLVAISEGERARDVFLETNRLEPTGARSLGDAFNCAVYDPGDRDRSVTWCRHLIDHPYGTTYDPHSWPAQIGPYVMEFFSRFTPGTPGAPASAD